MRFLLACCTPDSRASGAGRHAHGLGAALRARGHSVELAFEGSLPRALPPRFARLEFPWRVLRRAEELARASTERLVVLAHEPAAWPSALRLRRHPHVRVAAMVHACELAAWDRTLRTRDRTGERVRRRSRLSYPATQLSQGWLSLRLAARVLCLSSSDRDYITRALGVPAERVVRVDNGVEEGFLAALPAAPPTRDLLFVGSWIPRKGTAFLARALRELTRAGVSATLTLAGTGAPRDRVLAELPAEWRGARVIPHVPPDDLPALYADHRAFVLPSVVEGIPLSLLEAMAAGCAAVVSDAGGMPDVVRSGETGLVVPALDHVALAGALARVLGEPALARALGEAARARARELTWGRVAEQVERALGFGAPPG